MQILNAEQTARVLPYDKLVPAVAQAAQQLASGEIRAPERLVVGMEGGGVLLCMPAIANDVSVTKLITVHGDNARHGLPAIQGEVIVFDTGSGRRLALLDGPTVTARRTAAVTLRGIELLAPAAPTSALLIGTGVQAAAHADALASFFGIRRFRIASRNEESAKAFCSALVARHSGISADAVAIAHLASACQDVDLVIALTTSTSPVIPAQLPLRTMAIGVGAFKPEMAELPAELLHARRVVVDHLAGAKHEAGDLLRAQIDWSKVQDLAAAASGRAHTGVSTPVLKTVGHAAWDLAAARVAISLLP
ncbi:MAG TPA: delta(1)-pyrroline-2-carboxylate reductase family protein [Noviherbaspirillum sp.]|nr:delta(1)-pyrroline-2-carboxylate reductase family protein [Noviherbaspirillum sp.]